MENVSARQRAAAVMQDVRSIRRNSAQSMRNPRLSAMLAGTGSAATSEGGSMMQSMHRSSMRRCGQSPGGVFLLQRRTGPDHWHHLTAD